MPEQVGREDAERRSADADALASLEERGLIRWDRGRFRTTRRFQGAMMRAALRLLAARDDGTDLRVPIAAALIELLGDDRPDDEIAHLVAAMMPIQAAELPGASHRP